ncbi:MAG: hypothetical protein ACTSPV_08345 [Candidatus Hodarchaeales archaeon]
MTINATDLAGNIAYISYIYILDTTPISISLEYPFDNDTIIVPRNFNSFNFSFSESPAEIIYYPSWTLLNSSEIPNIPYSNDSIFLTVYASDGLNWCSVNYTFTLLHNVGRLIKIIPANNSIVGPDLPIHLTWSYPPKNLYWHWNNSATNSTGQCLTPVSSGAYSLHLFYQDLSDLWISYNYSFIVDADTPVIVSMDPLNNSYYSSKYSFVNFTFNEDISHVYFRWNVESNWTSFISDDTNGSILLIPIPSGFSQNLTLSLQAWDKFGNTIHFEYTLVYRPPDSDLLSIASTVLFVSFPFVALVTFFKFLRPYLKSKQ